VSLTPQSALLLSKIQFQHLAHASVDVGVEIVSTPFQAKGVKVVVECAVQLGRAGGGAVSAVEGNRGTPVRGGEGDIGPTRGIGVVVAAGFGYVDFTCR